MKRQRYNDLATQNVPGRNASGSDAVISSISMGADMCSTPAFLRSVPSRVPPSMIPRQVTRMPDISRNEVRLLPKNAQSYSTTNTEIIFDFPTKNPIDLRGGFIQALLQFIKTGGTYIRMHQGSHSWINKARIEFGNYYDEMLNYNKIYAFLWNYSVEAAVQSTIGYDLLGFGTQADRNGWGADPNGTNYVVPFFHGLFRQSIFPVHALAGRGLVQEPRITLYVEQPNSFIETDGASPGMNILSIRWHYHEIRSCGGRYEAELMRIVNSGAYRVGFQNFYLYNSLVPTASPSDIMVNYKEFAINSFVCWFSDANTTSNTLVNDKFITWPKIQSNTAQPVQYQIQLNTDWLPIEPIDTTGDAFRAYVAYLNLLGLWRMDARNMKHGAPISLTSYNTNQFIMVFDCRTNARDWLSDEEPFNNVNTANNTTYMTWRVWWTISPPNNVNANVLFNANHLVEAKMGGCLERAKGC